MTAWRCAWTRGTCRTGGSPSDSPHSAQGDQASSSWSSGRSCGFKEKYRWCAPGLGHWPPPPPVCQVLSQQGPGWRASFRFQGRPLPGQRCEDHPLHVGRFCLESFSFFLVSLFPCPPPRWAHPGKCCSEAHVCHFSVTAPEAGTLSRALTPVICHRACLCNFCHLEMPGAFGEGVEAPEAGAEARAHFPHLI